MKKKILCLAMIAAVAFGTTGCSEGFQRMIKDFDSNYNGGLDRKITAYDYSGNVLYEYEGRVDIQINDSKVLFDTPEGKRVILYNAIVVTEEQ